MYAAKVLDFEARFTQNGLWTFRQAHMTFAVLLGYRVRRRMKTCHEIQSALKSLQDARRVLEGIISDVNATVNLPEKRLTVEDLIAHCNSRNKYKHSVSSSLSGIDWPFVHMFVKQVRNSRAIIWKCTIGSAKWVALPSPGYWDILAGRKHSSHRAQLASPQIGVVEANSTLNGSCEEAHVGEQEIAVEPDNDVGASAAHVKIGKLPRTPPAKVSCTASITTPSPSSSSIASPTIPQSSGSETSPPSGGTPVALSSLLPLQERSSQSLPRSNCSEGQLSPERARSLKAILQKQHSNKQKVTPQVLSQSVASHPCHPHTRDEKPARPLTAPEPYPPSHMTGSRPPAPQPMASCPKRRKTNTHKPHLQIDVVMADKLSAPKKKGGDVDRKPGFKASLFLPSKPNLKCSRSDSPPTVGLSSMKLANSATYDCNVPTLNPVWNHTVYLPLPTPSPGADAPAQWGDVLLKDFWSLGYIKIEVLDGDRFNEDIFLGEAVLLMSGFLDLRPGSATCTDYKTMSGVFPLSKRSPSDRVTGSIHATAYLHMPITIAPEKSSQSPQCGPLNRRPSDLSPMLSEKASEPHTPVSSGIKSALLRISPISSCDGMTASERRRRRATAGAVEEKNISDIAGDGTIQGSIHRSSSLPMPTSSSSPARPGSSTPYTSERDETAGSRFPFYVPPKVEALHARRCSESSKSSHKSKECILGTDSRKTRLDAQVRKLNSLANSLQVDAEVAVQSLSKKLHNKKVGHKNINKCERERDCTSEVEVHSKIEGQKYSRIYGSDRSKLVLGDRHGTSRTALADAESVMERFRMRLNDNGVGVNSIRPGV
eukprot:CAMPEP_0185035954 /NCGR_PEP_ID=MMETSP1103-20130426/28171_1 /TAXON_ID=36769 /ORGANISM="Paraphysomonas bandaiensis, Strain Caron Lab Isolate" /LENGTH=825 /DNA_ID=CAMNT_0027573275 /DNA_START=559 /DNA_END=3036 /DNA_ORIENTATION=-